MWGICPLKIPVKLIEIHFLKLVIIPLNPILIDNTQQHGLFSPCCLGQCQGVLLHEAHPGPRCRYRTEVCRGTQQTGKAIPRMYYSHRDAGYSQQTVYDASMDQARVQYGVEL